MTKDSTGKQESEKQTEKNENKKGVSKAAMIDHIREQCVKDPFYITKMMLSVFSKHIGLIVLRLGIYVLVVFPFFNSYLEFSRAESAVLVLLVIICYYSVRNIYERLKNEVSENGST